MLITFVKIARKTTLFFSASTSTIICAFHCTPESFIDQFTVDLKAKVGYQHIGMWRVKKQLFLMINVLTTVTLLSGMPQQLIRKLQKIQNCSARLIFKTSKRTHASPLLTKLHWLPVAQRIEYKISSMCYDVVSETASPYLSDLLHLYIPSCSLRSLADTCTFQVP